MLKHNCFLCFFTLAIILIMPGCESSESPQQGLTSVSYMTVQPRPVTLVTELSGRTSAFMVSEVRPQVSGIIQQRLFDEGSDVREGDVLYQIDPAIYQAALDNAKAALMRAEANQVAAKLLSERYDQLVRVKAVSKQEHDNAVAAFGQAQADVAAAKAAVDTARINLDYTRVTAPVSGRIGRSTVTPGALVTQNQSAALATVQQLDPMYVDVTQSSTDLLRLKRAFESGALIKSAEGSMQTTLKLEDGTTYMERIPQTDPATGSVLKDSHGDTVYTERPVIGELKFADVTVEQSTGVVTIRAVFPNPDDILLPGMYVRAILEEGVSENAILIPQKTVIRNNRGLPVVQVLVPNTTMPDVTDAYTLESRIITVDRPIDNQWLVTEGLKEGEKVLLEGLMRVRPGMIVRGVAETADTKPTGAPSNKPADTAGTKE